MRDFALMSGRSSIPGKFGPRAAFTLIELLVVISILAILLVLGAGATFKVLDNQKVSSTENSLRMIDKILLDQWDKVVKDANKEDPSPAVLTLANGDAARARVLWIKFRLAEAFPQSYAEIRLAKAGQGVYSLAYIPVDRRINMKRYFDAIQGVPVNPPSLAESGACLLLALSIDRGGAKLREGDPGASVADTDGDGLKEFVDNWGKPIRFRRFHAGTDPVTAELAAMNPRIGGNKAQFGDPLDSDGTLQQKAGVAGPLWYQQTTTPNNAAVFTALCDHPFPLPPVGPQPFFRPYVASSGRDGVPSVEDDIYSFRLKVGARGD